MHNVLSVLSVLAGALGGGAWAADGPPPFKPDSYPPINKKVNTPDGAEMVYIPAGEFLMGSTREQIAALHLPEEYKDVFDHEQPQHRVTLPGYWMYSNDVTVAQYRAFCQATQRAMPEAPPWQWQDNYPITSVCWADATAYAEWAGVCLPSEAQWEKAARGTDGRAYPWGNAWDATQCRNSVGEHHADSPSPVGSFPAGASPYGCLDMVGNVWQWCADRYDAGDASIAPASNPPGPADGTPRVLRGGGWYYYNPSLFRCACRDRGHATDTHNYVGFRCCLAAVGA